MIFIKDLPEVSRMTPWFADAFEDFFPIWLQSIVPYYKEARAQGCDILWLSNFKPMGATAELYEKDDIGYYKHKGSSVSQLGFNADHHYIKCNWVEYFQVLHPDYNFADHNNYCNDMAYSFYMHRAFNRRPENNIVAKRCADYFKEITGDPEATFTLSYTSGVCFNKNALSYVEYYRALD
jgi:hypothetical protein